MLYFGRAAPFARGAGRRRAVRPAPFVCTAPCARSNRYYRTEQSLLPHEAIATTAQSNRYWPHEATATTARSNRSSRTKQSLLPHEAIAPPAQSNRYYRTKQSLLPHEASATTARSHRYYRTKPSLLPHKAIATTARSNRYYRTKQSLLPHPSQGPHEAIATTARSHRYYRTKQSLPPHVASATTAQSNRATTAQSNRSYRTKQSLLPHEAIATTARNNCYYRTKQSLLPHEAIATTAQSNRSSRTKQSLLPHEAIATTARSNRYYRTKQSLLPHEAIIPPARSDPKAVRDFPSCTLPVFSVFAILAHMIIIDGLSLAMQNLLQWYLGFSAPLVALALLSLSVFVLMLPLYHFGDKLLVREKQRKALLQAELDSIQELSGQRKYFYTKEVYRRYGYNPLYSLIGLFGLVLQLPFFVAAYQMLGHFGPFDGLAAAPFTNLQQPDALLPFWGLTLNLMPLLMTLVNLLSAYFYAESPEEKRKIWVFPHVVLGAALRPARGPRVLLDDEQRLFAGQKPLAGTQTLCENIFTRKTGPIRSCVAQRKRRTYRAIAVCPVARPAVFSLHRPRQGNPFVVGQ